LLLQLNKVNSSLTNDLLHIFKLKLPIKIVENLW